jgi:uncharacterized protein (TIGR01777 family)
MESLPEQRLRIVMAGGSGQIGRSLAMHFQSCGHMVTVLTRAPYTANWTTVFWDGKTLPDNQHASWTDALSGIDVLINLSGCSIARPFTLRNRREIHDSRVMPTRLLGQAIALLDAPPRLWMNASAAVIDSQPGDLPARGVRGHLAQLAEEWETEFFYCPTPLTRKVALRSALFLAAQSGNRFAQLSTLVRAGLGGTLGTGRQAVSWIHALDYARAIDFLIARDDLQGPFNMAAPEPVTNWEFMAVLRDVWDRPNGLPWPTPLMHLLSLLRADAALAVDSCHALPGHLLRAGFRFEFPDWSTACADLARQWRALEL